MKKKFLPIYIFAKISVKRSFRDKTAIFFLFLFPLIFLFIFGGIFSKNSDVSFRVALINQSDSSFAKDFVSKAESQKVFKVDKASNDPDEAKQKMAMGQLDATIILPKDFGQVKPGDSFPSGQAEIIYTQNSQQAGQTLDSILNQQFAEINSKFVQNRTPFSATATQSNDKSLSSFDYTFAGLVGFAILGLGIFGPVNYFPELKKQGVLRRIHTTPLLPWQYFMSSVLSQAVIGLLSVALMFVVAMTVFDLKLVGNLLELIVFIIISIILIFGIGLAVGGWAKNENQSAPLANLITFPMMFLSGTFFPRFMMPDWLQTVSSFLPLTPVIDGTRLIATEGQSLLQLGPQLAMMGAWIVLIYIVAFRVFRWE